MPNSQPLEGRTLSRYRILHELGRGGMGVVYKAEDLRLRRFVALKFLSDEIAGDREWVSRFQREAQAASALNHPGICTVYDIGEEGGRAFIVMEYLEGATLRERLAGGALPLAEAVDVGRQLAAALAAAHARGVTHRDIKPENVFLAAGGVVKLLDFGLAKNAAADAEALPDQFATSAQLTRPGAVLGTICYMSPEQVRGRPADPRSDVFSLGVTLYEAAAGRHPFAAPTAGETFSNILERPTPPLGEAAPAAAALQAVLDRALQKEPAERYSSAAEFWSDLQHLEEGRPRVPRSTRRAGAAHRARYSWKVLATAVACGVAIVAAISGAILSRVASTRSAADVTSLAVLPFVNESGDPGQEYFSDGLSEELLNRLARLPGLKVAGRTSSFLFKRRTADIGTIGARLGVGAVLEGTVRKQGNHLRITTQLVKTSDGFQLWSDTYDREFGDVFAIQDSIAHAVTAALQLKLLGPAATASSGTSNSTAYDEYLEGKFLLARRDQDDYARASEHFEQSVRLDPNFAPGFVGISITWRDRASWGFILPREGMQKARDAALRALQLDPNLADAHNALAALQLMQDWNVGAADESFRRARQLNSNSVDAMLGAATILRIRGRFDEALALARHAAETDPLNRLALTRLGDQATVAGQLDEAAAAYRKVLELDPDYGFGHANLAVVYLLQGRASDADSEVQAEKMDEARLFGTALVQRSLGNDAASRAALNDFIARYGDLGAYQIAQMYAFRGEKAKAVGWLERAWTAHDSGLLSLLGDPLLKSVATEPACVAIAAKLR